MQFGSCWVLAVTTASVSIAVMELDTSFELTDFLSEDEMEVMEVRQDIYESYDGGVEICRYHH